MARLVANRRTPLLNRAVCPAPVRAAAGRAGLTRGAGSGARTGGLGAQRLSGSAGGCWGLHGSTLLAAAGKALANDT